MAVSAVLRAEPASLAQIRREVASAAFAAGLGRDQVQALQIACGEAATNAVEHAYPSDGGVISLRTFVEGGWFWVEIEDHGRWRETRNRGSGHGLTVMRAFVDKLDIERNHHGTKVRMGVRRPPHTISIASPKL